MMHILNTLFLVYIRVNFSGEMFILDILDTFGKKEINCLYLILTLLLSFNIYLYA